MTTFFVLLVIGGIIYLFITRKKPVLPEGTILENLIDVVELEKEILFYSRLGEGEKEQFRHDLWDFLSRVRILGIGTEISPRDRLLVASSAVIPVFYFPQWQYYELDEVLIFEAAINLEFETSKKDSNFLGLVGSGTLNRKMILTRESLELSFSNKTDKNNVGIHEFIHLIDKADGTIDGLPKVLMDKQYAIPWLKLIQTKIKEIQVGDSDIDEYATMNLSEFLAVSGEYFFEQPDLMKIKHPKLYKMLDKMFNGKISS